MEFGPIFRSMTRNKLGVILISLQIAFTMTVIINAIFIINERSRMMARPSGMDEENQFFLRSIGYGDNFDAQVSLTDDLAMLRNIPGVVSASVVNSIPLTNSGSGTGLTLEDDEDSARFFAAIYRGDEDVLETMGLELVAGENFDPTHTQVRLQRNDNAFSPFAIVSESLANNLFPDLSTNEVVGKTVYQPGEESHQIIGVVKTLQAPWQQSGDFEQTIIVPEVLIESSSLYLIRTEPGQRDRLMIEVEEKLAAMPSSRILRGIESVEKTRVEFYRLDTAMTTILWVVIGTLVFITCMGIVGLAVFGINRRRKQIGTRRALGATKLEILRYFMVENLFITGIGVVIGAMLTIGFSIVLTTNFNMPVMAWYYTPLGMLALLAIGQISVLGPSSGAARIQPATATRSV